MKKKFQTAVLLVLAATLLTIVAIGVYVLLLLADPDNVFTLILAAFILIEFTLILSALGIIRRSVSFIFSAPAPPPKRMRKTKKTI